MARKINDTFEVSIELMCTKSGWRKFVVFTRNNWDYIDIRETLGM